MRIFFHEKKEQCQRLSSDEHFGRSREATTVKAAFNAVEEGALCRELAVDLSAHSLTLTTQARRIELDRAYGGADEREKL